MHAQTTCVDRCVEKFLKHSERVGLRFGELNQQLAEDQARQSS
jgi:hypothetical protein